MKPAEMFALARRTGPWCWMLVALWFSVRPGQTGAADPNSSTNPVPPKAEPAPAQSAPAEKPPARKALTGAELYAVHCNRCHPERFAPERTPEQWKTIVTHMRVRANLPAAQAREIMKFLQENSGR